MARRPTPPMYQLGHALTLAMVVLGPLVVLAALGDLDITRGSPWDAPRTTLGGVWAVIVAFARAPVLLGASVMEFDGNLALEGALSLVPFLLGIFILAAALRLRERSAHGRRMAITAHILVLAFAPFPPSAGIGALTVMALSAVAVYALTREEVRRVVGAA